MKTSAVPTAAEFHAAALVSNKTFQPTPVWRTLMLWPSPAQLPAVSGHSCTISSHLLFFFGGFDGKNCSSLMTVLDRTNYSHTVISTPLPPRCGHAACLYNDESIIIYGGSGPNFGESNMSDAWSYSIASSTFTLIESSAPSPYYPPFDVHLVPLVDPAPAMYGHALYHLHGTEYLLCFGGTTGREYTNALLCIHVSTWTMSRLATVAPPSPRYMSEFAPHPQASKLLLFGGSQQPTQPMNPPSRLEVFELDLGTCAFTRLNIANPPSARLGFALLQTSPTSFVLAGGRLFVPTTVLSKLKSRPTDQVLLFSLQDLTFTASTPLPAPRDFLRGAFCASSRHLILYGGHTSSSRVSEILYLPLDYTPPSLEIIALQQLCAADPDLPLSPFFESLLQSTHPALC